ncbi:MAG: hypothetical protein J6A01_04805 [Proteobacteria bacterium]|nr:hypothetical protein [Pseudomonadota bacterium]
MSNHWKLLLSVCALAFITACSEGEYNDLSCDSSTYVPNCLDRVHLMQCQKDTLVVVTCSALDYCGESTTGGDACLPIYPNYDPSGSQTNPKPQENDYLCTPGAVRCSRDYIQTCNGYAWINAETPCEHGCLNGICQTEDEPTPPPDKPVSEIAECSDDTKCESGFACNAGSCVPEDMLNAKAGDPCDESWYENNIYEICREDGTMLYCDYESDVDWNLVLVENKCDNGCTKVFTEAGMVYKDQDVFVAVCKSDDCKNDNEEMTICMEDPMMGASLNTLLCLPSTSGDPAPINISYLYDEVYCMNTCNADSTDCDDYGYKTGFCTDYEGKCDENNVYWYCIDFGIGVAQGVMECSKSDSICDAVQSEFGEEYGCWEPCTEIGDIKQRCDNDPNWGDHTLWTGTCTDFGNGQIYYAYTYEDCANLCDEEKLECVVLNPGDACDKHAFNTECIGNAMTACPNETVVLGRDCSEYGEEYFCSTVRAIGECREKCTTIGETKSECIYDAEWQDALIYTYECMPDDSGELAWVAADEDFCSSHQCADETSCVKLVDNEGEPCPSDMEEFCAGDAVVYCDEDVVTAINCQDYDAKCGVATINGTPVSDCYQESQQCNTLGEKLQQCVDSFFFSYEVFYECMDIDIGRYFAAVEAYYCDNQCNEDATACQ